MMGEWEMGQEYSNPDREDDDFALPDIEVFQLTAREAAELDEDMVHEYMSMYQFRPSAMNTKAREAMLDYMIECEGIKGGWFWRSCFPGCLPDSSPMGPFDTYAEALKDAQSA
jgi:hypothetical protein